MPKPSILAAAVALTAVPITAQAGPLGPWDQFLVFGDSLSDPGNLASTLGVFPPFPYDSNGQVSDGDTWASQLGADVSAGTNFAFATARAVTTGPITFDVGGFSFPFDTPDLPQQVAAFQAAVLGGALSLGSSTLAAVMVGGNDLRGATAVTAPGIIGAAVASISTAVTNLLSQGVDRVVVSGAPNLGIIPEAVDAGVGPQATGVSVAFNQALLAELSTFGSQEVGYFDLFGLFNTVAADPAAFGFDTPLDDTCLEAIISLTAINCDGFLFFDDIHPTEAAHAIIAQEFRTAVIPLPAGGALLIGALGALALMRRRTGHGA